ncbi:NAD(P)-dependent oxidoreductase [Blastococcus sp. KM273129]|uniref:NAD(P)-dependent oxidoreductase n=1 Tax=Blastococcus sp. KM273129 TaxID=2570315 RepID=UPI001F3B1CFB|nr:NAD(P)H-binding protein [Blastococcus sp. KM273129]MCF6736101.1 NAD-dependent epimerase/dehydratase family protein [Blastococcus sp. KM273129]
MARMGVFGGTGYAGGHLVAEAARRGHQVTSWSRSLPEQRTDGVRYEQGSLLDPATRAAALEAADVVVVAVAPRGDMAGEVRGGIAALAAEAERAGVRLGVVGGTGSLRVSADGPLVYDTPDFPAEYRPESVEMAGALAELRGTESLDWFYVSPPAGFGAYAPGEPRGTYRVGGEVLLTDDEGGSYISGADFARALVDEIEQPAHRRAHFTVAY